MTDKAIFWYVLYVRTGSEEKLLKKLKARLNSESYRPFIPKKTCIYRRQGDKSLFHKICFPGYVFIKSDKPTNEFTTHIFPVVYQLEDAYRFLCYGDKFDMAMREEERATLSRVLSKDYCIGISSGFKERDSIKIISGALFGSESKILRINRN